MKKSFMTRVLAMGLSFAMAFSLSAATNVTTASAAAKKVGVTTMMKVSTKSVTEGKTVKTYMNSTALKKYRIKKVAKLSAVADKYIDVDVITTGKKARQGLEITAHEGAVTAAKLTKKGVYVTIYFAQTTSPSKAAKAPAKKYAKLKVAVQAKPVEKTTMTAAATAVKEITLTFSKAVADTTAAKIAVKKGNATPTFTATWAEDAKSVKLAMDSKLTKGTYDVTVSGVDKDDLTASIAVEDQKLTAFELISTNLVAVDGCATKGSIYFRAVDQYGNNVAGVDPTVTTSFGGEAKPKNATKATENTKIEVTGMSTALAILGTKGTITIVDNKTGVNLTSDITYSAPAKASKVEVVGIYRKDTKKKVENFKAYDNATNFAIALKFTDQYDAEMAWDDATFATSLDFSLAAGTTSATEADPSSSITVDDKTYYAYELGGTLKAGTIQITVVNKKLGLLDNLKFDVAPGTVIKSFSVSADNDIFAGEKATLSYVAVDADGKEVTDYDVLDKAFKNTSGTREGLAGDVTLEKQKDGSAKLCYKKSAEVTNTDSTTYRGYDSATLTFQLYPGTTNVVVVNTPIRINQKRVFWEVTGVNSDKAVAGVSGTALTFKASDLKIGDQYGNTLSKDEINDLISTTNTVTMAAIKNDFNWSIVVTEPAVKATTFGAIVSGAGVGASAKIKIKSKVNTKDTGYELLLSEEDAEKASSFEIKWKDSVSTFYTSASAITAGALEGKFDVVGKVGGKTVTIPTSNWKITAITGGDCLGNPSDVGKEKKTVEGTVTVTVSTTNDDNKYVSTDVTSTFTSSNVAPALASIKADKDVNVSTEAALNVAGLAAGFELKDQYGRKIDSTGVAATVVVLSGDGAVQYNGSTECVVTGAKLGDTLNITLTKGDLTANRELELKK